MGKGSFIAVVALLVAIAGAIVAFAAYFRRRGCALCEGMDEMMDEDGDAADLDYYATQLDDEEEGEDSDTGACANGDVVDFSTDNIHHINVRHTEEPEESEEKPEA